ncbi:MAG: hypothetical protein ACFFDD_14340 [Promethearchaeota archaeon]
MTEGPIRIGSFLNYQIVIFLLVIIWAFIGFEMAQFQLLPVYEKPYTWIGWAIIVLTSIIPVLMPVIWRMKTQIIYVPPEWNFREREVSLTEYGEMMKQYRSEYRDFLSVADFRLIFLAFIIALTAVTSPFLLMRTNVIVIAATPVIFGIFVLLFGLVGSSILFKYIPNEVTPHFPIVPKNDLRSTIEKMQMTPGISWAGVSLTIGEASGYYTIRDARPVSRIEGIEGVARIQGTLDEFHHLSKISSVLTLDAMDSPTLVEEYSGEITHKQLARIVYKTLQTYIDARGEDELLDEVLEDVTNFLKQFNGSESS